MKPSTPERLTPKHSTPEPFSPPPLVHQSVVIAAGLGFFVLGSLGPVLIGFAAFALSLVIPYCFRTTDYPEERRRLFHEFKQRSDPMIQKVLSIPDDVALTERYWINSRGMALCTSIMTPKHQETKAVLFYCHGYCDNASFMKRHNLLRFVKQGIAVATIEYEGHGRSDGPLGLIPSFDRMVDDAVEYFTEVSTERFPGKKCFLMGESMGGAVAYLACQKKRSLFSGVVFVAPMCKISDALKPPQWIIDLFCKLTGPVGTNGYLGYLPIAPVKNDMDNFTHRDIIMRDLTSSAPFLYDRNPRLTTARELLHTTSMITSQLESFDLPFLVQHGKADKVTDPKLSQALYNEAKSKDKTIKLYDGMYHAIMSDVPADTQMVLNDSIHWILKRV